MYIRVTILESDVKALVFVGVGIYIEKADLTNPEMAVYCNGLAGDEMPKSLITGNGVWVACMETVDEIEQLILKVNKQIQLT